MDKNFFILVRILRAVLIDN